MMCGSLMISLLILWLVFGFFSFGVLGLNYFYARATAKNPWKIKANNKYMPKVSIIVPTYNEYEVIEYKLRNLARLEYPNSLMQMVFIDSQSTDSTVNVIRDFAEDHPDLNIEILVESERRGKSSALNTALKSCSGDVIVVSDADCFWPPDILSKALSYLADLSVGAVSGPKKLLNPESSSVTRSEEAYLESANLMKLGDSKKSSTILFEGGFSAYKREVLGSFDPYDTGSDDCGTVIRVLEKNFRAVMIPEAEFFTAFPGTWMGKLEMKLRRTNQLLKVLKSYVILLFKNEIKTGKEIVAKNLIVYLLAPVMFLFFVVTTVYMMVKFPLAILLLLVFLIPKISGYLIEATLNYLIILYSIISTVSRKKFAVWKKPEDRTLLTEDMLLQKGLI
jgi:cellulose synthase/poly-beta-1,6-N-acetylglucosamine synthase-like glycosyltransferase